MAPINMDEYLANAMAFPPIVVTQHSDHGIARRTDPSVNLHSYPILRHLFHRKSMTPGCPRRTL
jgi:hypothetical protein